QLHGHLQLIDPLMRRGIFLIEVDYSHELPAGLKHAPNLTQRQGNVAVVVNRLHRERVSKFVVSKWKLLRTGNLKFHIGKRSGRFLREPDHLVRYVDADYATIPRFFSHEPHRPAGAATDI